MSEGDAMRQVSIEKLFVENQQRLGLNWLAGRQGGNRVLTGEAALKPTIGQVGHMNFIHPFRVQMIGAAEASYLRSLPEDALQQGDVGALMAPADRSKFRLNIGVRTLDQQVKLAITVTDKDGNVVKNAAKTYDPNYFLQDDSGLFLDGYSLGSGDTISFEVTSGSAFIYGGTTDNATSDPSVQFARRSQ